MLRTVRMAADTTAAKKEIEALAKRLTAANEAYHNSDTLLMTDAEYDAGLKRLSQIAPKHPLLLKVGASVGATGTQLPSKMASLNKVHPDSQGGGGAVRRWVEKQKGRGAKSFVVMEKLDGLSALWWSGKRRLYLRGDGVKGVDVSSAVGTFLKKGDLKILEGEEETLVRGELVLSEKNTPAGSIGRSLVNGWIHRASRGEVVGELSLVDFVAYQVISSPPMTRIEQTKWLTGHGFKMPRTSILSAGTAGDGMFEKILNSWKTSNRVYPIDGIVVGTGDIAAEVVCSDRLINPSDAVAFKMIVEEQLRTTRVVGVEWNASPQGYLIPRIQIEPVEISGAKIEFCSGHNARAILSQGIGAGAEIRMRRSGDVIPTVDAVLSAAPGGAAMPVAGWEWVGDAETATHIRVSASSEEGAKEVAGRRLTHVIETLRVVGVGPGIVAKLMEEGYTTPKKVWGASVEELQKVLGQGRGKLVWDALRAPVTDWKEMDFMIASARLPRGVGERKLLPLFAKEPDVRKWTGMGAKGGVVGKGEKVEGWTATTLAELFRVLPEVLEWRQREFDWVPVRVEATTGGVANKEQKGVVVFSGVRSKGLEEKMIAAGWVLGDSITKATTLLVVKDTGTETGKAAKARSMGIRIGSLEEMLSASL